MFAKRLFSPTALFAVFLCWGKLWAWTLDTPVAPDVISYASGGPNSTRYVALYGAGIWTASTGNFTPLAFQPHSSDLLEYPEITVLTPDGAVAVVFMTLPGRRARFGNAVSLTTNSGLTWDSVAFDSPDHYFVDFVPDQMHPGVFYALAWDYRTWEIKFAISVDYGEHWSFQSFFLSSSFYFASLYKDPLLPNTLWFQTYYMYPPEPTDSLGGLLRSDDMGQTWRNAFDFHGRYGVTLADVSSFVRLSNGDLLLGVSASNSGDSIWVSDLLRSIDDGLTWESDSLHWISESEPYTVFEDLNQPGRLYAQYYDDGNLIVRSNNSGLTWQPCENGLPTGSYLHDLKQNPFTGSLNLNSYDDGIFESINGADSWEVAASPEVGKLGNIYALDASTICSMGYQRWFRKANDSNVWAEMGHVLLPDTEVFFTDFVYDNSQTIFAAVQKSTGVGAVAALSHFVQSSDGGVTWQMGPEQPSNLIWDWESFVDDSGQVVLLGADRSQLYLSENLGTTWLTQPFPSLADDRYRRNLLRAGHSLYFCGSDSVTGRPAVYRRAILGGEWENLGSPFWDWDEGVFWVIPEAFDAGIMLEVLGMQSPFDLYSWTSDGWRWRTPPTEGSDWSFLSLADPLRLLVTTWDGRILISHDTAMTWQPINSPLPFADASPQLYDLALSSATNRIWLSTTIGPCYLTLDELLSSDPPRRNVPIADLALSIAPNPFNEQTAIRYEIPVAGQAKLELFDLTGRQVKTLADEQRVPGNYLLNFKADGMASGVYFLRLSQAGTSRTAKILLLR